MVRPPSPWIGSFVSPLRWWCLCSLGVLLVSTVVSGAEGSEAGAVAVRRVSVREFGAVGDGVTSDTAALNRAIEAATASGRGEVRFPPGQYLSGTLRLRSHLTLHLEAGAQLLGTTNLAEYQSPVLPPDFPGTKFVPWYRALLLGEEVRNVTIEGPGVIDGRHVFDPRGEEQRRGPHTVLVVDGHQLVFRDVTVRRSANYAFLLLACEQVEARRLLITGGWDGIHLRGTPVQPCRDISIVDCRFHTGDDSLAGWYWDGVVISNCVVNSSCNGLRLIGPARRLTVTDTLFYGPGAEPHRTSGENRRTHMLSGILLQPGAWESTPGALDQVRLTRNSMDRVASPVTLDLHPGNTVGEVVVDGLTASRVYQSALSFTGSAESPLARLQIRDAHLSFAGGVSAGEAAQLMAQPTPPTREAHPRPAWGLYVRHVESLLLHNVNLSLERDDFRPAAVLADVNDLIFRDVYAMKVPGVPWLVTTNVGSLSAEP